MVRKTLNKTHTALATGFEFKFCGTQTEIYWFSALEQPSNISQGSSHVNSIEREQNSRYFSQASIFLKETLVSIISSIWYR